MKLSPWGSTQWAVMVLLGVPWYSVLDIDIRDTIDAQTMYTVQYVEPASNPAFPKEGKWADSQILNCYRTGSLIFTPPTFTYNHNTATEPTWWTRWKNLPFGLSQGRTPRTLNHSKAPLLPHTLTHD